MPSSSSGPLLAEKVQANREGGKAMIAQFLAEHPAKSYGYEAQRVTIPTRDGGSMTIKICTPLDYKRGFPKRPLLFAIHGGGWQSGAAEFEEMFELRALLTQLTAEHKAVGATAAAQSADLPPIVILPEYRLAPEHPCPGPVNDCIDALEWTAAEMEFDRIVMCGASAGGHLAAVLALELKEGNVRGLQKDSLSAILLTVPLLCHWAHWPDQGEPESYALEPSGQGSQIARGMWDLFAGTQPAEGDWRVSPLLGDLRGLCKTGGNPMLGPLLQERYLHVTDLFVAGKCPFASEGQAFYSKLQDAGVPSKLHLYQGATHSFSVVPGDPSAKTFQRDFLEAYKAGVRPCSASRP